MSAIFPINMLESNINLTDPANPINQLVMNGRNVYIEAVALW